MVFVRSMPKKFVAGAMLLSFGAGFSALAAPRRLSPASLGVCANCAMQDRMNVGQPMQIEDLSSALNVASVLQASGQVSRQSVGLGNERRSPIQYGLPELLTAEETWNGQGDLPGAFKRPWSFGPSHFDPSFVTPYYTEQTGPIDHPMAPWRLFLPQNLALMNYNLGMAMLGLPPVSAFP